MSKFIPSSIRLEPGRTKKERALRKTLERAYADTANAYGRYLLGEATWNPGSLADGAGETSSGINIEGVGFGHFVVVAAPYDLQGILCIGYVSAANTVKIRLQNETGGVIDLASGTWKVKAIP